MFDLLENWVEFERELEAGIGCMHWMALLQEKTFLAKEDGRCHTQYLFVIGQ